MSLQDSSTESRGRTHVHTTLTYLALAGITVLFLGLSAAYLLSRGDWTWSEFRFPKLFLISTLVLLCSSYFFHQSKNAVEIDNPLKFRKNAYLGLITGAVFLLCQIGGWYGLSRQGIYLAGTPDGSFLYIISAVHALHILVGLLLLLFLVMKKKRAFDKPVDRLLLVTNKDKMRTYSLAIFYWHFVDILWIYLLFFLLFNHL